MAEKKKPLRKCVACGEFREKNDLIRVVKTPEDAVLIDESGRLNGRGAYICKDRACIEKAKKSKALNRVLKFEVDISIYEKLLEEA